MPVKGKQGIISLCPLLKPVWLEFVMWRFLLDKLNHKTLKWKFFQNV